MSFQWPWALLGLVIVPLAVWAYRALLAERARRRGTLAAMGLVATPQTVGRMRHLFPALLIASLGLLALSLARPEATVAEPRREGTVVLAFDVSNSMAADDLQPTRLEAAKTAAIAFVQRQPSSIRVGVVAFGDSGVIAQSPTNTTADAIAAIKRLEPSGGTAVGGGILASLNAIAGKPITVQENPSESELENSDIGYYGSSAIVLLSDGENTSDPDPMGLADVASVAGVKIHTIGLGTPGGTVLDIDGYQVSTALDETMLTDIAERTDGTYHRAEDGAALAGIYDSIKPGWRTVTEKTEVSAYVAGGAALLLLAGVVPPLLRRGRVV